MNGSSGPGLVPRRVLFGNSECDFVKVSRDGTRIAFLAPLKGVMNVWAAPLVMQWMKLVLLQTTLRGECLSTSGHTIQNTFFTSRTPLGMRTGISMRRT